MKNLRKITLLSLALMGAQSFANTLGIGSDLAPTVNSVSLSKSKTLLKTSQHQLHATPLEDNTADEMMEVSRTYGWNTSGVTFYGIYLLYIGTKEGVSVVNVGNRISLPTDIYIAPVYIPADSESIKLYPFFLYSLVYESLRSLNADVAPSDINVVVIGLASHELPLKRENYVQKDHAYWLRGINNAIQISISCNDETKTCKLADKLNNKLSFAMPIDTPTQE